MKSPQMNKFPSMAEDGADFGKYQGQKRKQWDITAVGTHACVLKSFNSNVTTSGLVILPTRVNSLSKSFFTLDDSEWLW
jgi:hypothetical protein